MEEEKNEAEIVIESNEEESQENSLNEIETEIEDMKDKKIKNLTAILILVSGLFLGSLIVDSVQLVKGGGFSQRALSKSDVFRVDGKTWVAYSDSIVKVQVINDDSCEACKPDEALVGLRRVMPTMLTEKVSYDSEQGKALLKKFGIKTVPAYIFSKDVENVELFSQAQGVFEKKDDLYALKTAELGLPIGKYVEGPAVSGGDIQLGSQDSKVKFVEFNDFQSSTGKKFHQDIVAKLVADYGDKILYVYKPVPVNPQSAAMGASLASLCANEQGKFSAYADKLFATQDVWGKMKDANSLLKGYALQLGLKTADFNKCLDDKKYQDQITQTTKEAQALGLTAIPSTFINEQLQLTTATYDDVKKALDEKLVK